MPIASEGGSGVGATAADSEVNAINIDLGADDEMAKNRAASDISSNKIVAVDKVDILGRKTERSNPSHLDQNALFLRFNDEGLVHSTGVAGTSNRTADINNVDTGVSKGSDIAEIGSAVPTKFNTGFNRLE